MEKLAHVEKSYRRGPAKRSMAYLLVAGITLIWLFALRTIAKTLQGEGPAALVQVEKSRMEKSYRLSRAGRHMAYLLLAGSVLIWLFALWTLKNTLQIALRPSLFIDSIKLLARRLLRLGDATPLTAEELIPALIMLVLAVVVPLLIWNLIEEVRSSYTVNAEGIIFRSLGVELAYPWSDLIALRAVDEEAEEALDEIVVRASRLASIRSALVRFLHWQAYGPRKLPLYGGLSDRDELVSVIRTHLAAPAPQESQPAPPDQDPALSAVAATGETQDIT